MQVIHLLMDICQEFTVDLSYLDTNDRMSSELVGGLVPFTALHCSANGPVMQS